MEITRKIVQQQQQHSLFSQASWGRLEMKPERKIQGSGTLIASLQALLSKAISLEIFQSLRSLLTESSITRKIVYEKIVYENE